MGKLRVHELAKKLNLSNQEVLAKLNANGVVARTHSSSVDEQAAYRALGLGTGGEKSKLADRPRTVLRRRKEEEEFSAEKPVEEEVQANQIADAENVDLRKEEGFLAPEEIPVKSPITASSESFASREKAAEKPLPKVEKAEIPVTAPLEKPGASASTGLQPSNVVRVIDAEAIRARLASEGRSFGRRGGAAGGAQGRYPSSARRTDGAAPPRAGEDSAVSRGSPSAPSAPFAGERGAAHPGGGQPAGARPNKKKKSNVSYSRDMRESHSGGRELWAASSRKKKPSKGKGPVLTQAAAHKRVIEMTGAISVNDLAHRMAIKAGQVVSKLLAMGMMVTVNEAIDFDTATIVAGEFGFEVKNVSFEESDLIKESSDEKESLKGRAPIVTVMGHVDHGKTSLLDALRETAVAKSEAGGITQHIGAYSVNTSHGPVTFLDTPGHEAFTSMRARGAQITDIVVLVVAADDGVMPQTKEAIDHAKAAKCPVVVAINKMDLPDAKPERVMQQLSEHGLVAEEWGGDTQFFKISATKRTGLHELVEGLSVLAEMLELKANPDKPAQGCVVEAKLDKGRGPVATILTQAGTLKVGDYLVAGEAMGRVRAMYDSRGEALKEAGPATPIQVLGLSTVPTAGDQVNAVADDKTAKTIANHRAQKRRENELLKTKKFSLETFLASSPSEERKSLKLIVKADVYGSVEALVSSLENLSTKEVKVEIVHSGVGTITESNVALAMASHAIIIGFNIKADGKAAMLAQQEKIDLRYYSVIYEAIDEVRKSMAGLLAPLFEEQYLGKAEVRMIIPVSKHGKIAGCYVLDGRIIRSGKIRVKRKTEDLFVGTIASLKRFKDDVKEVTVGYECGIGLDGFNDIQEGDILECFELKEVEAKLSEAISKQDGRKNNEEAQEASHA
jgi:translation initiation factor IF-2